MRNFFILIFVVLLNAFPTSIHAQNYSQGLPDWVYMIDNPSTNYFEAMNAFNAFWKDKFIWDEEEEMFERPTNKKEEEAEEKKVARLKKALENMSPQERQTYDILKYHYKRFKNWAREILPYVQEDGRILPLEERISIWNKQQQEIRK